MELVQFFRLLECRGGENKICFSAMPKGIITMISSMTLECLLHFLSNLSFLFMFFFHFVLSIVGDHSLFSHNHISNLERNSFNFATFTFSNLVRKYCQLVENIGLYMTFVLGLTP